MTQVFRIPSRFESVLLFTLCAFSFYITFRAGERGFFAFDQSIVFDGSYRILCGQVPYRDFVMPVGPVTFFLQAFFFKLLGISYFSYIFGAAFINTMATLCAFGITRMLFPEIKFLPYVAGWVTAIWFYPPFGTPWTDQTAFFFSFVAITSLLAAHTICPPGSRKRFFFLLSAGCAASLSLLSKQNAGLFILPVYFLCLAVIHRENLKRFFIESALFLSGFAGAMLLFMVWLLRNSNVHIFSRYVLNTPGLLGVVRILEEKNDWLRILLGGSCSMPLHHLPVGIRLVMMIAFVIGVAVYLLRLFKAGTREDSSSQSLLLAAALTMYAVFFQNLFVHTTMNEAENGIPFIGIILALSAGGCLWFAKHTIARTIVICLCLIAVIYVSVCGIQVSLNRKVQEFRNAQFPRYFTIDNLKALKWGEPTWIPGLSYGIGEADVRGLLTYLKEKNKHFFVFPDFTMCYGLLNVPSPQPVLWFHKGLTYSVIYDPSLDNWVVDGLKRNEVEIVVLEQRPRRLTPRLDDFPVMSSFIAENFIKTVEFGIFSIYERKSPLIQRQ